MIDTIRFVIFTEKDSSSKTSMLPAGPAVPILDCVCLYPVFGSFSSICTCSKNENWDSQKFDYLYL